MELNTYIKDYKNIDGSYIIEARKAVETKDYKKVFKSALDSIRRTDK